MRNVQKRELNRRGMRQEISGPERPLTTPAAPTRRMKHLIIVMKIRLLLSLALTAVTGVAQVPYPGHDSEHGPVTTDGYIAYIAAYTGNVHVSTRDLTVAGAVGQHGLSWQRFGNSRRTGATLWFGSGHNWSHNWQWEMVDAGRDDQGRAVLTVYEPEGAVHRFLETASGRWQPEAAISEEIVSEGAAFHLLKSGGREVHFARKTSGKKTVYQLQAVLDDTGNRWTFEWQKGRLVQVNEPAGRWLKISYAMLSAPAATRGTNSTTVISQVTASDGQVVAYAYDFPAGVDYPVIMGATYPDATHATYTYSAPRKGDRLMLEQAEDPRGSREMRGRAIRYRAEPEAAEGQVARVERANGKGVFDVLSADTKEPRSYLLKLPNGSALGNVYHPGGYTAEEIDPNGFVKKHEYSAGRRGFKISTTDALGHVTRFENDAKGNVVKTIHPDGASKTWQRDAQGRVLAETDELGQTRRYSRDQRGRVTRVQHPDGSTEEMSYNEFGQVLTRKDRNGAVTASVYDGRGLLRKTISALGATTVFGYNLRDQLVSITDTRGNTTHYERDAAGRIVKTGYADGTSTSAVYDAFGQLIQSVDASGAVNRMTYDELGRIVSITDPLGHETRSEYAPVGETAPWARPIKTVAASGRATSMSYDAAGQVIARTIAAGTWDAATTRMSYDAGGRQISVTNPLGQTFHYFYDKRGRQIKTMSALGHATVTTYDAVGRRIGETDPNGNTTRWTYDAMGRELSKTDAKGQTTRREYDGAGRLVALIDAKLNTYRFEYDLLGRQTAFVYPDGSRESTTYDAGGLKLSTTNRAGVVCTFGYDNRNREISSIWSDGSQQIIKAYDAAGRMTLEDNGVSKLTFAYDRAGRLASETQDLSPTVADGVIDPAARSISYTYNADGQRETLGYPDGTIIRRAYNIQGQLADILGDGFMPPIASYEYDAAGNPTRMPRENETETARTFDADSRMLAITEHGSLRNPLSELEYAYDEFGNRVSTTTTDHGTRNERAHVTRDTYSYDETHQVTGADYGAQIDRNQTGKPARRVTFTYDSVGNRVQVNDDGKVTRYTTNNLNQYTRVGRFAPAYDRNGNLAATGEWLYKYDAMNRLISASNGDTTATFYYDGKNRCVARKFASTIASALSSSPTLTLNYYDDWNLVEERDAQGRQLARYVYGRDIDEIVLLANGHGVFYPHRDVIGNVTMLTDASGTLVERYKYSVEGEVTIVDANGVQLAASAVGNRWMFTGREWLSRVGLYDYRNRMYSANIGRFMQRDPIKFHAKDINIYRYAGNNYVNWVDPNGFDYNWVYNPIYGSVSPFNNSGLYQMTEYQQMAAFPVSGGNVNAAISTISSYEVNFSTAVDHFRTQISWLNAYHENGGPGTYNSVLQTHVGPLAAIADMGHILATAASTVPGYAEAVGDFLGNTGTILVNHMSNWWNSMWSSE